MNKLDFVELININQDYENYNLYLKAKGFVMENNENSLKILFINEFNEGDYAFVDIFKEDLILSEKQPPKQVVEFLKINLKNFNPREKGFKSRTFKAYQQVKLLVEDDKYSKFGVHKGDIGTIMEDVAIQDHILVDFGRLDENNEYYGDCISVKLKDVIILQNEKE